jgi:hypothetical protein
VGLEDLLPSVCSPDKFGRINISRPRTRACATASPVSRIVRCACNDAVTRAELCVRSVIYLGTIRGCVHVSIAPPDGKLSMNRTAAVHAISGDRVAAWLEAADGVDDQPMAWTAPLHADAPGGGDAALDSPPTA